MTGLKVTLAIFALVLLGTFASAQTIVPLNTGYDHAIYNPYPAVTIPVSTTQDRYWINIASYPTTSPAVAPAFVLESPLGWLPPLPSSSWISATNQVASATGTNPSNPAYTIFRKCFCLLPNYTAPQISFTARADDTLQVWFNSQVNVLLPPQAGSFAGPALPSLPSNPVWFHVGLNCIYALVEDTFGVQTGFNLAGTIQANGLAPQPALGVNQTFTCPCNTGSQNPFPSNVGVDHDDREVVAALVQIAEERRLSHTRLPMLQGH